ncbi:MAG: head-tail connector protein [Rhodospirillales bacterium]|nr:head-tail connector protein [Rhodospirillales bacterium]
MDITPKGIIERYRHAKDRRGVWESHWQECYDYALPQRDGIIRQTQPGEKKTDKLFDGTAPDAVDQLAASLLGQLTPPWARWFGFIPGPDTTDLNREEMAKDLEHAATAMKSQFDRSNFAVEMHQCYLDLVTAGTASLLFEEAPAGEPSAFRFTAVPLSQVVFEESTFGKLDTTYRRSELTQAQLKVWFPNATLPEGITRTTDRDPDTRIPIIEAVIPDDTGFAYLAVAETDPVSMGEPTTLSEGRFAQSPFINFRWLKAPGEIYGRSPVMKTLPDIKTANKVVELVLKNASIAVTGIWQADDDGVLNPATIKLTPGTVIPKAVGSAGLTPLEAPGRFDVSEIVLGDLRSRIRQALLADKLGQIDAPKMTATEVLERAADMARVLGATYGRLQSELLSPLVNRALSILARRGEIADFRIDGRIVDLEYKSPLASQQARQDAQNTMLWLDTVKTLGPEGLAAVDLAQAGRWLGRAFGVPSELIRELPDPLLDPLADPLADPLGEDLAAGAEDLLAGLEGALPPDLMETLDDEG